MKENKLYINRPDGNLIVKCTSINDDNETFCGYVYDNGQNERYKNGYKSTQWMQFAFKEYPKEQVGGNHYNTKAIQPIDYILANQLNFCEGNVVKYITRYKDKNGVEDLKKAKQYIDFLIKEYESKENI